MKTPKEYSKNLENGIITTEMLKDALFSVNKRAKNYRNIEAKCRQLYRGKYSDANRYKKEKFYEKKSQLLSLLEPVCIHREFTRFERTRVYDYQKDYRKEYMKAQLLGTIVWQNGYYDYERDDEVYFFDYVTNNPEYRYYLYYICGDSTFHTPIEEKELQKYNLEVVDIGILETSGYEPVELISMQFVDKILTAIKDGSAKYERTIDDCPPEYPVKIPVFSKLYEIDHDTVRYALDSELNNFMINLENKAPQNDNQSIDYDECYKRIFVSQKILKSKSKPRRQIGFKSPTVKYQKRSLKDLFYQDEMVNFIKDKITPHTNLSATKFYNKLCEICISDDSPIYDDLIKILYEDKIIKNIITGLQSEANIMHNNKPDVKIIFNNGKLEYANQ